MNENRLNMNGYPMVIDAPREGTASLLAKVLGITSLGFLITAGGVATAPDWATLPGMIAVLVLVFAITLYAEKESCAGAGDVSYADLLYGVGDWAADSSLCADDWAGGCVPGSGDNRAGDGSYGVCGLSIPD